MQPHYMDSRGKTVPSSFRPKKGPGIKEDWWSLLIIRPNSIRVFLLCLYIRIPMVRAIMGNMHLAEEVPVRILISETELWVLETMTMITMYGDLNSGVS